MLLTTPEICKRLHLNRRSLAKLRREGLPYIALSNTTFRYFWEDVLVWLKTKAPATPEVIIESDTEATA